MMIGAGSLGGCTKAAIAKALGMKPIPHDEVTEQRFSEGNLHEGDVIARFEAEGTPVTRQQEGVGLLREHGEWMPAEGLLQSRSAEFPPETHGVWGKLDGVVDGRILEIKSMSDSVWKDFQRKGWHGDWPAGSLIDKYRYQISVYQLATGLEAMLATKNRNSGALTTHGIEMPFYTLDQITERVSYIEDHVSRGQLPDDCLHDFFCDYRYLCQTRPPIDEDLPVQDAMFEQKLREFDTLTGLIKLNTRLRDDLKGDIDAWLKLAGRTKATVGDYTVSWVTREIPESVRKASTQSFPQVKKVTDEKDTSA